MATYFGDATIVDVQSYSGTRDTGSGTTAIYTVPAGHFSEVYFISGSYIVANNGSSTASAAIGTVSVFSKDGSGGAESGSVFPSYADMNIHPVVIDEGQSVTVSINEFLTTESSTLTVLVKEYKKP